MHNEEDQHIIFAGESYSGKTRNAMHVLRHLFYLGKVGVDARHVNGMEDRLSFLYFYRFNSVQGLQDTGVRVFKGIEIINAMSNAATPLNPNSTRCVFEIQATFGKSGKASGGILVLYQLEKWRVSSNDR